MKYYHPDFKNYVLKDDDDQHRWWSPEKERARASAERQRELERAALKRGTWPIYAAALLSLFCLAVAIGYLIAGSTNFVFIIMYFLISLSWGGLTYGYYSTYKKAKANVATANVP